MSHQLYSVVNDQGQIVAVFSTEDLAQTHAAKVRVLNVYGNTVTVKPLTFAIKALIADAEVRSEVVFMAALDRKIEKVRKPYKIANIDIHPVGLGETLPRDKWEQYAHGVKKGKQQKLQQWLGFEAFGWSPAHALAKLEALVADYREQVEQ